MSTCTDANVPRRMDWRGVVPDQGSLLVFPPDPARGEWEWTPRVGLQPGHDVGGGVGGEVVQHYVHLLAAVGLDGFLQERKEVGPVAGGSALTEYLAGGNVQRGEQVRGSVPYVVVGAFLAGVEV